MTTFEARNTAVDADSDVRKRTVRNADVELASCATSIDLRNAISASAAHLSKAGELSARAARLSGIGSVTLPAGPAA